MAIQFILGPAGSGKSTYLQKSVTQLAMSMPERKFLLIVPDQFNMQTQKEMIIGHPNHAFSNIEVLSFSRLSHRILEEVGGEEIPVLDDTGKSLIIRHIAEGLRPELTVMGSKLGRVNFVHEVKSAISEFMQYGYGPDDVHEFLDSLSDRKQLAGKFKDLEILYRGFLKYKEDKFITREETLDKVRVGLHNSRLIKNAYIVFDGFTGFTPIQERVIEELMLLAGNVVFSFAVDADMDPYHEGGEQELFWLTRRSISRLKSIADKAGVVEDSPVYIKREEWDPDDTFTPADIRHLERNLFRYPFNTYQDKPEAIHMYVAANIREEIADTCQRISTLTKQEGYQYRDIAVVTGDLATYADDFVQIAQDFNIPIYMDYSRPVVMSPYIEAIRAAFDVVLSDFSTESVMRFLRTGYGDLTREACDELENYLFRTGRRGYSSYSKVWTVNANPRQEESEAQTNRRLELADRINSYREHILNQFGGLHNTNKKSGTLSNARDYSLAIYKLMSGCHMYQKLLDKSEYFAQIGDRVKESEYKQVYGKVIELLDQIVALVGDEPMTLREYRDILEAGFGEIKLGVIPQESDVVVVGDITRSRLKSQQIVFFLGVNESNIPGGISSGGLISDLDREYIKENTMMELAPTPREQIFTQRLYLYMNMTKPTKALYISYVQMDVEGKSQQASYLIHTLCKLFPKLQIEKSSSTHTVDGRVLPAGVHMLQMSLAELMREYVAGNLSDEDATYMALADAILCQEGMGKVAADVRQAGTAHMKSNPLAAEIAEKLYGRVINTSISRLEKFASCAYAHFLAYGMQIRPRTEFGFERRDMGDIFHAVLEEFANRLDEMGISWKDYSEEISHKMVDDILENLVMTYGETVLLSSARTLAMSKRMGRILRRTVDGLQYQIKQGEFVPTYFERVFKDKLEYTNEADGKPVSVNIRGKIDRIDICEDAGKKYLRIVDYKSGNRDFDINALYYGLTLQLSVYMKEALKKIKGAVPAGMLYYHISDPMIDSDAQISDEEATSKVYSDLKMKGVVSDNPDSIAKHDRSLSNQANVSSEVIPVGYKKDGLLKANSSVLSDAAFDIVLEYTEKELCKLSSRILQGEIDPIPYTMDANKSPCNYCDYKSICPIKSGADGYETCVHIKQSEVDIITAMKKELGHIE